MLGFLYFAAASFLAFGALSSIWTVGKPRGPLTGGVAAVAALVSAGIITLLVIAAFNV